MLAGLLARVGLNTLKKQIVGGLIVALVVIVPATVKVLVNSWKSDIQDQAVGEITNTIKDGQIETLQQGKEVDETVLQSDDAALCALLGGCLRSDDSTPAAEGDGD